MSDLRRISTCAVVLLVVLRLGLGWQLLYEGLWKYNTLSSPRPWTSEGYLKNSQGPMRNVFRNAAGDPDDFGWITPDVMDRRWNEWKARFASHYQLNENQKASLERMVDGVESFAVQCPALPPEIDFKAARVDGVIRWDQQNQALVVDGVQHLLPREKDALLNQIADKSGPVYDTFRTALEIVARNASRLSYKERMRAHLMGDPDNAGRNDRRISELNLYRHMAERLETKRETAQRSSEFDHLTRIESDYRSKNSEVAGPVKALDAELQEDAMKLLTTSQLQLGRLPPPWSVLRVIDILTITGLLGLGFLLLIGLCSRGSAFMAALMVFGFYLAMPPLPGVPEAPGPEHSLIVNKNLIEVLALLALSAVPSGRWFGVDGILCPLWARWRHRRNASDPAPTNSPAPVPAKA